MLSVRVRQLVNNMPEETVLTVKDTSGACLED